MKSLFTIFLFLSFVFCLKGQDFTTIIEGGKHAFGFSIIEGHDNDLIVGGHFSEPFGAPYTVIFKVSLEGDIIWEKKFINGPGTFLTIDDLAKTDDGYYLAATSISKENNGVWEWLPHILKFSSSGNVIWEKTFDFDFFSQRVLNTPNFIPLENGDFLLYGVNTSQGFPNDYLREVILIRFDKNGNTIWEKILKGDQPDISYSKVFYSDGVLRTIIFSKDQNSNNKTSNLINLDIEGNILNNLELRSQNSIPLIPAIQLKNGQFAGFRAQEFTDRNKLKFFKIDIDGELLTETEIFIDPSKTLRFTHLFENSTGGIYFFGVYFDDHSGFIIEIDKNGNLVFKKEIDILPQMEFGLWDMKLQDENIIATGTVFKGNLDQGNEDEDFLILKRSISDLTNGFLNDLENLDVLIKGNPAKSEIHIDFQKYGNYNIYLFDALGIIKYEKQINSDYHILKKNNLLCGHYFLVVKNESGDTYSSKVLFVR